MNTALNIKIIKTELLRTAEFLQSIEMDQEYWAEDLIIRSPEFVVKEIISAILDEVEDGQVNHLNVKVPELPHCELKSFL
jgi:hypothetical protein